MTAFRRSWLIYLAAMTVGACAYLAGPLSHPVTFNVLGASSVAAIVIGARHHLGIGKRRAWYLVAAGQALFIAGDVLAYNFPSFFGGELPFPSIADVLYLACYPAIVGGLVMLIHHRDASRDGASLVDVLIVTVGVGTVSWVYLIAPYAQDDSLTMPVRLTSVAYPVMDLVVAAVALRLAVGRGGRGPAWTLLLGGVVALFATDAVHGALRLNGSYEVGGALDGGWLLSYAMLGAAALHGSMRGLSAPAPAVDPRLTWGRLAMLAVASMLAPGVALVRTLLHQPLDVTVISSASIAVFALVLTRMAGLVRLHEATGRLLAHRASHDDLTGLPNRALFRTRVDQAIARTRRGGDTLAVLFLDLDDFKTVNDSLGHAAGDELLTEVARRLDASVRAPDTTARFGGDEFAVLLDGIDGKAGAIRVTERIIDVLSAPVALGTCDIPTRTSIGIALLGPGDSEIDTATLLHAADVAMYAAKHSKRRYEIFDHGPATDADGQRRRGEQPNAT